VLFDVQLLKADIVLICKKSAMKLVMTDEFIKNVCHFLSKCFNRVSPQSIQAKVTVGKMTRI